MVPPVATTIQCTQCGGELHPDEGELFLTCPYCGATVYLDKSQVVFHWYLAPTLDENEARGALARWMAGNETVKDLDRKARLTGQSFEYFPVWYFKRSIGGREKIVLEPAAATSVTELRHLTLPAGDLRKYDDRVDDQAVTPTVPADAAVSWLAPDSVGRDIALETALVHIPVYTFKYEYQGRAYTALVEAATGRTLANIYPAKAEAPFLLAGGLTALVFLCLATFPVIGAAIDVDNGLTIGIALCLGLGVLTAPALFTLAAWVAAKI